MLSSFNEVILHSDALWSRECCGINFVYLFNYCSWSEFKDTFNELLSSDVWKDCFLFDEELWQNWDISGSTVLHLWSDY